MPFKPGQSGNPGGRPKGLTEQLEKFRRDLDLKELRAMLFKIATNEANEPRDRIAAIKEWHDRAYGKAAQSVTASVEVTDATPDDIHAEIGSLLASAIGETDAEPTGEPH